MSNQSQSNNKLMAHKDTINDTEKNSVFTPENIVAALEALPKNYIGLVRDNLQEKVDAGTIKKNYSKNWIAKVRNQEEFNEEVLQALVEVGLKVAESPFNFLKKKTPSVR